MYEKDTSHFPDNLPDKLTLDPDDPDSFLNFFWQDEDLEKIVKETNKYIDKKIIKNNKKEIKLTTLAYKN